MPSNTSNTTIDLDRLAHKRPVITDLCIKQAHKLPLQELCAQLNLSDIRSGLTTAQVKEAQDKYGLNQLAPPPQPGYLRLFFLQTFTGFNALLWIAAVFAFLAYQPFGNPDPDPTK
jgi:magnesium-transporting ATPase (P-type)